MTRPVTIGLAIAIVVVLCIAAYISAPNSPVLLAGAPEPPHLASRLVRNVLVWIALDLVLSFGVLVWALIFKRSWLIVPYLLYWILVLGAGVLTYGLLDSRSLAFAFPTVAAMFLGAPWTFLLVALASNLEVVAALATILPGEGIWVFWIGILINQVLLALLALKAVTGRRKPEGDNADASERSNTTIERDAPKSVARPSLRTLAGTNDSYTRRSP